MSHENKGALDEPPRRNFLVEFWTVLIGSIVGIFPLLAGLAVLFDPLRKSAAGTQLVRLLRLA